MSSLKVYGLLEGILTRTQGLIVLDMLAQFSEIEWTITMENIERHNN